MGRFVDVLISFALMWTFIYFVGRGVKSALLSRSKRKQLERENAELREALRRREYEYSRQPPPIDGGELIPHNRDERTTHRAISPWR